MQVCTSLQTDNHASTPPRSFFTGQMPFLPPNQQRQSTEGSKNCGKNPCCLLKIDITSVIDANENAEDIRLVLVMKFVMIYHY